MQVSNRDLYIDARFVIAETKLDWMLSQWEIIYFVLEILADE